MSDHPLSIVRVTWLAKYRKVLAETGNEGEAIFEADRSMDLLQCTGRFLDRCW
jgi:hypothetical protein